MHNIGSRREPFWDDFLIDRSRTSAEFRIHQPISKEIALVADSPWEGDGCIYGTIIKEKDFVRLYYTGCTILGGHVGMFICYAESRDGISFAKPPLGVRPFGQSYDTNIILGPQDGQFDNFAPFKDTNPECPPDERYKAMAGKFGEENKRLELWCYTSPDGINWKQAFLISDRNGSFDTLNCAFWDENRKKYICYIRNLHCYDEKNGRRLDYDDSIGKMDVNLFIRDIRCMASTDFKNWSEPEPLDFGNAIDYPLYTNCAQVYERAPQIYIGFPTRYVERTEWTKNVDSLPGLERRKARAKVHPRYGLATTDCLFMSSRDGGKWFRHDEAIIRPGMEREFNWVYGDCYPAAGMVETKSDLPYAPDELSMYMFEKHWSGEPSLLRRMTVRKDGFVSMHAGYAEKKVVTGELLFEGDKMELNFSTSAPGYIYVKIKTQQKEVCSCELYGDSLDRIVPFEGELAQFSGLPVTVEFTMCDADIFSMRFFK